MDTTKRLTRRRLMLTVALTAAAGALGAFALMTVKDRRYAPSAPFEPEGTPNADVAVVYYSRTGHSEAVAREVARTFNAPIARITADYPRDFSGQLKAVSDARDGVLPRIDVAPLDLTRAKRVYLVSPTWWFRPATPLWSFVERADFSGKEVILMTTGNTRFEQDRTDAFAERVASRGGQFIRHDFLRRGRFFWQLSREQLLEQTRQRITA